MTNTKRLFAAALAGAAVLLLLGATTPGIGPETDWVKVFKRTSDNGHFARTNIFRDMTGGKSPGMVLVISNVADGTFEFTTAPAGQQTGETNYLASAAVGASFASLAGPKLGITNTVKGLSSPDLDFSSSGGTNLDITYKSGSIVDSDIAISGISTRTKLPADIAYENENNIFGGINSFGGLSVFSERVEMNASGANSTPLQIRADLFQNADLLRMIGVGGNPLLTVGPDGLIFSDRGFTETSTQVISGQTEQQTPATNSLALIHDSGNFLRKVALGNWPVSAPVNTALGTKQDLDPDLTAIAGLAGTGYIVRTGAGTANTRSIVAGQDLIVQNGNGISGNTQIDVKTNTATQGGIVESPNSVPNKAWATDGNGIPGWRDFSAGAGEVNVGANVGTGTANTYIGKSGVTLQFATVKAFNTTVNIGTNSDGTMNLSASNINTLQLVDAAVTTAKIADNNVNGAKIQIGSEVQGDMLYYNGTDWTVPGDMKWVASAKTLNITTPGGALLPGLSIIDPTGTGVGILPTAIIATNGNLSLHTTANLQSNMWQLSQIVGDWSPQLDNRQSLGRRGRAPSTNVTHFLTVLKQMDRAVTNAGSGTPVVADANGPSVFVFTPSGSSTIEITNCPTSASSGDYRSMLFIVGQGATVQPVTFKTISPIQINTNGVIPFMAANRTNYFLVEWFNTNCIMKTFQEEETGVGPLVRALTPTFQTSLLLGGVAGQYWGTGSPEGVVTANVGSTYSCTNGCSGTSYYYKTNGTGNTGWWSLTGAAGTGIGSNANTVIDASTLNAGKVNLTNQMTLIPLYKQGSNSVAPALGLGTNYMDFSLSSWGKYTNDIGTNGFMIGTNHIAGNGTITTMRGLPGTTNQMRIFPHNSTGTNYKWMSWSTNGSNDIIIRGGYTYTVYAFVVETNEVRLSVATDDPFIPLTSEQANAAFQLVTNLYDYVWIDAGAMTTNAALAADASSGTTNEIWVTGTNKRMLWTQLFDPGASNACTFTFALPYSWDTNVLPQVKLQWSSTNAIGGGPTVVWGVSAVATVHDQSLDTAYGTEVTVSQDVTAANELMLTSATSDITPAGNVVNGTLLSFRVRRLGAHGSDDAGGLARLLGAYVRYKRNTVDKAPW